MSGSFDIAVLTLSQFLKTLTSLFEIIVLPCDLECQEGSMYRFFLYIEVTFVTDVIGKVGALIRTP